ncbi:MAG: hypothetical protein ACYDH2_12605 [Anaerolineaceae bacterium]
MDKQKYYKINNQRVIIHWEMVLHFAAPFLFILLYNHAYIPFAKKYITDPEAIHFLNVAMGLSIILFGLVWVGLICKTFQQSYSWRMLYPGAAGGLSLIGGLYLILKVSQNSIPNNSVLFYLFFFGSIVLMIFGLCLIIIEPVPLRRFDPTSPEDLMDAYRGIKRYE